MSKVLDIFSIATMFNNVKSVLHFCFSFFARNKYDYENAAVNVRSYKENMVALYPAHSRFIANSVSFLRRYFAGNKELSDLIA